jgi:hypothetical protein
MRYIFGYMHSGLMGHWKDVNFEMLRTMLNSGLLHNTLTLDLVVTGDSLSNFRMPFSMNSVININHCGGLEQYEYVTQQRMYDDCVNMYGNQKWIGAHEIDKVYVFYCCNAGVSHPPNHDHYPDWRHLMSHFNFTKWRDCVAALDEGYDTVGIEWQTDPVPHWSGNFWWATAEYIASLPSPEWMKTFNAGGGISHRTHPRHGAEWWVGMNKDCKHHSLFQTGYSWRNRPRKPWKDWLELESVKFLRSLGYGNDSD